MRSAILGTAGHIDHGKTALVKALTGTDTDRLPEEKARGITIDLGFAELIHDESVRLGIVDVPGHEDFIRTMVAGATGMDVVLMAVAADEGIMPQTREHLDIVRLLGVPSMVVALTKADLVDGDWLALVEEDVRDFLAGTPYAGAPVVATSAVVGTGLPELTRLLAHAAAETRRRTEDDLARLPVDRAFTVQGMGTVVTGTLWEGTLAEGDRVRLLPGGGEARIRSLQVHGRDTDTARAGERTAAALTGLERTAVGRGDVLVTSPVWGATRMLTVDARVLSTAPRGLEDGARVRVLLGTAEAMARCAVLDGTSAVTPGGSGWVQLRLERPTLARAGDRVVLRSYSPMVTVGGGVVVEPTPPKRRRLDPRQARALAALAGGEPAARVEACLELGGWVGARVEAFPQTTGLTPGAAAAALPEVWAKGGLIARGLAFSATVVEAAKSQILSALDGGHALEPLRPAVPLERLRGAIAPWASPVLADGVVGLLARGAELELAEGGARRPHFRPRPTPDQERACQALRSAYEEAGLAAPFLDELPAPLRSRTDLPQLLRFLEGQGALRTVAEGLLVSATALEQAAQAVAGALGGRTGLGPSDFRDVLAVSRRHLMPLLAYLDGLGVTVRRGPLRDVPPPP